MPSSVPPGFLADANIRAWFVPDLADPTEPSIAELPAGIDITCYLTAQLAPNADVATVTDDRMCLRQVLEAPGSVTYSIDELMYVYDVQNPASVSNELYAAVPRGTTGFIIIRYGIDVDVAPVAATQFVDVYPVEWGPQIKMPGERNTKAKVRQKPFVTGPMQQDVAFTA